MYANLVRETNGEQTFRVVVIPQHVGNRVHVVHVIAVVRHAEA